MYISLKHVSKTIRRYCILDDISLEIPQHSIIGITGSNGSGKSMLLKAVTGLVRITAGEILIQGKPFDRGKKYPLDLGVMFDSEGFWEGKSGLENLKFLAGIQNKIDETTIIKTMELVGLDPQLAKPTSEYSMGMKQRLNLAQAIMESPELLVLDEPTNALDRQGIALISNVISKQHEKGATILVACHNQPQLEEMFSLHVHMYEGKIEDVERKS